MSYETITQEMIQALTDEINAIKEGGGGREVPVQDGLRTGFSAGRYLYTFIAAYELTVPDDAPAQLKIGDKTYSVTVVTADGFEVTLAVADDLGIRVPLASLNTAPYFLLELLRTRLNEILSGKLNVNKEMALRLFNQIPNESLPPGFPPEFAPIEGRSPNEEQRIAVLKALSQRITFVWGPPGTGKTTTINYLVPALLKRGERVFITSHTNTAVDAVLKAAKKGLTPEEINSGAIIRLGQPKETTGDISDILLEAVVERRSVDLRKQEQAIEAQLGVVKSAEEQWSWWDTNLKEVSSLAERCKATEKSIDSANRRISELEIKTEKAINQVKDLEQRLEVAMNAGLLRRLLTGMNPDRIRSQIEKQRAEIRELEEEKKRQLNEVHSMQSELQKCREALAALRLKLERRGPVPAEAQVIAELQRCRAEAGALETKLKEIRKQISHLAEHIIREAKVIGTTLSKLTITPELYNTNFDNIVIDEAGMIPQPHLWLCSSLATKRVILLGDFRQLPPICIAEESPAAKKRIARSIFEEAGIIDDSGHVKKDDPRLSALRNQYRMHEIIGELANALVYSEDGHPLVHCADPSRTDIGRLAQPESESPLVLYNTSAVDPWCARQSPGYSRYNIYSAILTVRLAEEALKSNANVEIGVMSPYTAQARLLQQLITEHNLSERVKVATVHRFQGGEKDIIIVDLVDGNPFKPGRLLTDDRAKYLLNVAFTRAKGKLILVSNCDYFDKHNSGKALEVTHQYFGRHAKFVDGRTILAGYGDPETLEASRLWRGGLSLGNPVGVSWHNEGSFYPAFKADLASAEREVIIFSPFVQPARTAELASEIRSLIERGVTVHLITRPSKSGSEAGESIIRQLKSLGVNVATRDGLHEKLAFIDERITWMGSLNILSHSRTTEQMVRFENPRLTAMILDFNGVRIILRKQQKDQQRSELLRRIAEGLVKRITLPPCPECGQKLVLKAGKFGPFFACQEHPKHKETINVPRAALEAVIEEIDIQCPAPACEGKMRLRTSSKGFFLGCSKYPECTATMSLV
ncbi:MAG TPA: AAA family ATPase [Firmicutes bacterium]|nr:AAA family ATPase [Candidatus Fermentithermobacillaceae bacterium]